MKDFGEYKQHCYYKLPWEKIAYCRRCSVKLKDIESAKKPCRFYDTTIKKLGIG